MGTDWKDSAAVADGFDAYDDLPERVIGYPEVFRRLGLGTDAVRTVLDYGCGPGKVALRAAEAHDVDVTGVDISERMVEIARTTRPHPRVTHHHIESGRIPFLADGSVDAAMSCYVYINVGDLDVIRSIAAEVHRVLRPGGRYAVLDTNPDSTGIRFSTFRNGEPGRVYGAGERRQVDLYQPGGGVLTLSDYHWPRETYGEVLAGAGFRSVDYATPLAGADDGLDRERADAPFLIVTGVK